MKILPVPLIREADAYTIAHEPVASTDLMERAGSACAAAIARMLQPDTPVVVVAGQGNNGGDGLVIARILHTLSIPVQTYVLKLQKQGSPDFEINLQRLAGTGLPVSFMANAGDIPEFPRGSVVIDALFGSGLSRPVTGLAKELIDRMNRPGCMTIAIDIPSGLNADDYTDEAAGAVVRASHTLSLELPKLAMLMPSNFCFTGKWEVVPIGLDPGFIERAPSPWSLFRAADAAGIFKPRERVAHKGDFGHGLLVAGSREKGGAAIMAASAALRCGAGLLTVHVPGCLASAINVALPEAMLSIDKEEQIITSAPDISKYSALAAGPGIGIRQKTQTVLENLLDTAQVPLLLDADALNILAHQKSWLKQLPPGSVLTPHPREFERLAGDSSNEFDRLRKAIDFAMEYQCFVVLKSAFTAVISPNGQCSFNANGNAGLAKGGSGDTLTGIILGLLCRGYKPWNAARLGVYIHARAAEIAARTSGLDAILASDVTANTGLVFKELEESAEI